MKKGTNNEEYIIKPAERVTRLPPYLFGRLNAMRHARRQKGEDIIDLGMGNPMDPAPQIVVEKLCEAAKDPRNHRYSASKGIKNLRGEMAKKYARKWGVDLDPDTEVLACIGSKEGFSHMCLALLGPGDTAIVPDPAFPIHNYGVILAGANVITVPLGNDQKFLDTIAMVCETLFPKPKLLILNYPHNPTAMTVDPGFFEPVVDLAKYFKFQVIHDFAYGETLFDGYKAPSFLSTKGAKDVGVEFTTMSKPYSMAGFRVGFVAGNKQMIDYLATIKGYYDYGIFQAIQIAGIIAMRHCDKDIDAQNAKYQSRRDVVCDGLQRLGWQVEKPRASMFVWTKAAEEHLNGKGTIDYAMDLMEHAEVAISPGRAFGENGEGYFRIALVENEQRLRQAIRNISRYVQQRPVRKARAAKK
ncbi:MAG TPA: aminotransferase class I/II-fold pyridoxal phosphate-dependent enzyme [Sedimentisphaerales bacterium]|nr:aminotransferase class I/II-fold pyridoxal phosphate-dependent enzyme [Phycisphaerae bacterium]HON90519.1 aminotransferase class I/II-fold pyridoxal phosphate-dependent enzyme [Sedimentisphaerales bacterium]HQG49692.1 aminotransferase class I/II-fold pyridoxal phosphate-dependent enzyme [Sedimentisphaerales bacterium]